MEQDKIFESVWFLFYLYLLINILFYDICFINIFFKIALKIKGRILGSIRDVPIATFSHAGPSNDDPIQFRAELAALNAELVSLWASQEAIVRQVEGLDNLYDILAAGNTELTRPLDARWEALRQKNLNLGQQSQQQSQQQIDLERRAEVAEADLLTEINLNNNN